MDGFAPTPSTAAPALVGGAVPSTHLDEEVGSESSRSNHRRVVRRFKTFQLWGLITAMILRLFVLPNVPSLTEGLDLPPLEFHLLYFVFCFGL